MWSELQMVKRHILSLMKESMPPKWYISLYQFKYALMIIRAHLFYHGTRHRCLMCARTIRKYLPAGFDFPVLKKLNVIGGMRTEEGKCPFCFSLNRERLVYYFLKHKTEIFHKKTKVMHFAPEVNLRKKMMGEANIEYHSADLYSPFVQNKIDVADIPYPAETFDVIICNHVLEHVPNDRLAMAEIYRVLKPGGWAIVQVPISSVLLETFEDPTVQTDQEREKRFGQHDHVRIYARDYKTRLEATGAHVRVYNCEKEFGEGIADKYQLIKEEDIYIMEKPIKMLDNKRKY